MQQPFASSKFFFSILALMLLILCFGCEKGNYNAEVQEPLRSWESQWNVDMNSPFIVPDAPVYFGDADGFDSSVNAAGSIHWRVQSPRARRTVMRYTMSKL